MIHHSLTEDGKTVSWGAIERYHTQTQKWSDIGYHFGVELIGDEAFSLLGRWKDGTAAACREGLMNQLAYHVCVVGNYDLSPPSEKVLSVLVRRVLVPLMKADGIQPSHIVGHRDFAAYKTCPGKMFDLEALRKRTAALLR